MRQHDRIDVVSGEREWMPILATQLLDALKQPAIDEHSSGFRSDEIARARDGPGGAQEGKLHAGARITLDFEWLRKAPLLVGG